MQTFFKTIKDTVNYWYIPGIVGLILVLFGSYLFTVPMATFLTLSLFFALSFLVSGILEIFFSIQNRNELEGWGWYLTGAIFNLLIGLILLSNPELAAVALPFFIGFSLLFRSFQGLGFSFELKNYGLEKWGYLTLISVLGIVFSFLLIIHPVFTGISLAIFAAISFVLTGVAAIVLSVQLRKLKKFPKKVSRELREKIEDLKEEYYEYINRDDD